RRTDVRRSFAGSVRSSVAPQLIHALQRIAAMPVRHYLGSPGIENMTTTNIVEAKGRVGIIRLYRPQVLNALNKALVAELNAAVANFDADPNIGCILVTGSEKAFAAGADIKEMAD